MNWLSRSRVLPPFFTLLLTIGLLEGLVRCGFIPDFLCPAPSEVFLTCLEERVLLGTSAASTAFCSAMGLVLSFVLGSFLAISFSLSPFLRRAIYPFAIFFQTVPLIAVAPLLVIWFGFGQPTVIASSFIVSFFPILANVLLGLKSTDPQLDEVFRFYSASKSQILFKLKIPFALPQIFVGLRIASGLAIVGAIVGEFIGGGGLGSVVDIARTQQRVDLVFAAVLISSLLGLAFVSAIQYLSNLMLRKWHVSETG